MLSSLTIMLPSTHFGPLKKPGKYVEMGWTHSLLLYAPFAIVMMVAFHVEGLVLCAS